jgi:hypothetical protein
MSVTTYKLPLLFVLATLLAAGCAVSDGEPWGWARADISASGPIVESGGEPADGITVESVEAFANIRLAETRTSSGGDGSSFDPASPPDGYTLCHNNHCHAENGDLVSYEDVREELASSGGSTTVTIARLEEGGAMLDGQSIVTDEAAIRDAVQINTLEIEINLDIRGTIDVDGTEYDLVLLTSPFTLETSSKINFGPGEPMEQTIHLELDWSDVQPFEGIDFSTLDRGDDEIKITQVVNRQAAETIISALQSGSIELAIRR